MTKPSTSSITDKPISSLEQDKLKSKRYAETLATFIQRSDTPLTVGLQGEWGTGKTSMMYMLREILENQEVATSWVNTWEYSMFRGANQTTPAVLRGMLEKLKESCEAKGTWSRSDEANQKVKKIGRFIGNLANQVVMNQVGLDVKGAAETENSPEVITEISFIKSQINEVIQDLIEDSNNKYNRVVFFVDDLDRIPPTDAVEVLEALKNMFDVPNCIYVLAIDYDVVVKGLEGKFGKKTEENEREFRSFFDKIIQVPFSMPTGTYDISQLLQDKLGAMGIGIPEDQVEAYTSVVKNTVGFNPRSLKRFMNSFSLLRSLRHLSEENSETTKFDDLVLFGLLGLQISYNKIFRLVTIDSCFWKWDSGTASKFKVDVEKVDEQVDTFGEEYKEKVDEVWEKIIYGFCNAPKSNGRPDPYLSARWQNIVDLFNDMGDLVFEKDFSKASDKELDMFETAWNNGLSFAAITNVDDDPAAKSRSQKKRVRINYDSVDGKIPDLLAKGARQENLDIWKALGLFITENNQADWTHSIAGSYITAKNIEGTIFFKLYNPTGKGLGVTANVIHKKPWGTKRVRPESEMISKTISNTEFKIKIDQLDKLDEVKEIFNWACQNS